MQIHSCELIWSGAIESVLTRSKFFQKVKSCSDQCEIERMGVLGRAESIGVGISEIDPLATKL